MSSTNTVEAGSRKKEELKNSSPVEIELYAIIIFDGLLECRAQSVSRDVYCSKRTPNKTSVDGEGLSVYSIENPKAKPSDDFDKPSDETHIHQTFLYDLRSYDFTPAKYLQTMITAKQQVKQFVQKYCNRKDVYSVKFHSIIFGYNVGSVFVNILQAFGVDDEAGLNKKIKEFFDEKSFFNSYKLAYKELEAVRLFDPVGVDYGKLSRVGVIITGSSAVDASSNCVSGDAPINEDVVDAAVMCQHTYYAQTDIEQSVWEWAKNKIKELFTGKKKEQPREGESIKDSFKRNNETLKDVNRKVVEEADNRWSIVKKDYVNNLTGFYAKLYKKREKRGGREVYAFCTCGTNFTSLADWLFTNIAQGLIGLSPQYTQSVNCAKELDKEYGQHTLFFIGHSLGGGLASNNAMVTKTRHAITFNAAGLNAFRVIGTLLVNNPSDLLRVAERKEKIHAFVIEGEILNFLLGNKTINLHEGAYGKVKTLDPQKSQALSAIKSHGDKHAVLNFLKLKGEELKMLEIS